MRKLYEIFKVLKVQKRIVSTETICGITVFFLLQNAVLASKILLQQHWNVWI